MQVLAFPVDEFAKVPIRSPRPAVHRLPTEIGRLAKHVDLPGSLDRLHQTVTLIQKLVPIDPVDGGYGAVNVFPGFQPLNHLVVVEPWLGDDHQGIQIALTHRVQAVVAFADVEFPGDLGNPIRADVADGQAVHIWMVLERTHEMPTELPQSDHAHRDAHRFHLLNPTSGYQTLPQTAPCAEGQATPNPIRSPARPKIVNQWASRQWTPRGQWRRMGAFAGRTSAWQTVPRHTAETCSRPAGLLATAKPLQRWKPCLSTVRLSIQ